MRFEFMQPILSNLKVGRDTDAVCVTNPVDIKFRLKKLGVKISYECGGVGHGQIIEKLGRLPLLRTMAGGIFIVGVKNREI